MSEIITAWFRRHFSDPQAVTLVCLLVGAIFILMTAGHILAPALASLVIAYLLQGIVNRLERFKIPHFLAVILTFSLFVGLLTFAVLGVVPLLWEQANHLIHQMPQMVNQGQLLMGKLSTTYAGYGISDNQVQSVLFEFKNDFAKLGQFVLSASIASIPTVLMLGIYLVVVPLMVYFFLMDKTLLINWAKNYFPKNRSIIRKVWFEVNRQIGNYIRGKVLEIIIVTIAFYAFFAWMHLPYAMLLSALVGISVILPYIGVIIVTVPVVLVGLFQWGWNTQFAWLMLGYTILVALDGNLLVPLLFSEVVNLHPIAIILSILFFGGLWGFWGVFFAIPLAIVIKALLEAWPRPLENPPYTKRIISN